MPTGSDGQDELIEIETTTYRGRRMIISVAPGYSQEDVLAEPPAIHRTVQDTLERLRTPPASA